MQILQRIGGNNIKKTIKQQKILKDFKIFVLLLFN